MRQPIPMQPPSPQLPRPGHPATRRVLPVVALAALGLLAASSCSAPADDKGNGDSRPSVLQTGGDGETTADIGDFVSGAGDGTNGETVTVTGPDGTTTEVTTTELITGSDGEAQMQPSVVDDDCGGNTVPTAIKEVALAFVFDVSASMGIDTAPEYSRDLKWEPVVAATKAFFADAASEGLSASLTFFPNEEAPYFNDSTILPPEACDSAYYESAAVAFTPLPSAAFEAAIAAVTPAADNSDWRYGTPTLPALAGTYDTIDALQAANPGTQYSVVLVTDGAPSGCAGSDNINTVAAGITTAANNGVATYVIGVEPPPSDSGVFNPGGGAGSLSNLDALATAGGTELFLVNTTDPEQTKADFLGVVSQIREASFSCEIPIPGEGTFDPTKVNVDFEDSVGNTVPYALDQACTSDNSWRYNDPAAPTSIELCPSVCDSLRAGAIEGQLSIALGCPTIIVTPQ